MRMDEEDAISFFRKNRMGLLITAVILMGALFVVYKLIQGGGASPRKTQDVVMIRLPPPPPPPPTPPQQPTPEERIVEEHEQKIDTPEEKPKDEPVKPPDEPPIGTGIKGDGKGDGFGLSGSGGSGFGGGGSRFDWYAGQVQRRIADALRNNRAVRQASLSLKVRVWTDPTGRISHVELASSTGDPSLDAALKNEVLTGLQLSEGPPEGMPMPILLRLTAKRPQQAAR